MRTEMLHTVEAFLLSETLSAYGTKTMRMGGIKDRQ
jgi:hypothetical protein